MPHSMFSKVGGPGPKVLSSKVGTVSTTALPIADAAWGFDAADLAKANRCIISGHVNAIHYLWNGTTPTATFGHHLDDVQGNGFAVILGNANVNALQCIREGGADAEVTITLEE